MRTKIEHGAHSGDRDRAHVVIETIEDYELATRRLAALDSAARGGDEERERDALLDAIGRWDRTHDDATRWKE